MNTAPPKERLLSLDALRGFDMAMIVGLGEALRAIALALGATGIAMQFEHVAWEGFRLEDLIFPLFVFIAGVSQAFSLPRAAEKLGVGPAAWRLLRRCALLYLLGVIYSGGFSKGMEGVRWLGVLQRIALASLGAGLLSLVFKSRGLVVSALVLLVGYWVLLSFVSVNDVPRKMLTGYAGETGSPVYAEVSGATAGDFREGRNLANWMDARFLAGRKHDKSHDPEGILSTLPAIATALLGVLAGLCLQGTATAARKAGGLALAGLVMLALGWAWSWQFPVIKKLWTSSFVLVAGGWSALLLAAFYWLVEIRGWRAWTTPFVWIGANSIAIYVVEGVVPLDSIAKRFTGQVHGPWGWLVPAAAFALVLLLARFLHKRGIFIRL
jgi:predicted acyltransferase